MNLGFKKNLTHKIISVLLLVTFGLSIGITPSGAQLPPIGQMVWLTPGFQPPVLRGMTIRPENPLAFDFIVDRGQDKINDAALKDESTKLIKFFLASMTIPDKDAWVNLSPYEKDRVIPDALGQTEMGRQMLEQDYMLKQLSASLTNPDKDLGQKFWNEVKARTQKQFNTTEIPLSTFNKVWIMPDTATVVEKDGFAYISESKLKVMLDEDYQAQNLSFPQSFSGNPSSKNGSPIKTFGDDRKDDISKLSTSVFREMILPQLIKEVNEGKTFAATRQVYQSVILASWYKKALKDSLLGQVYADQSKIEGITTDDKGIKQKVYEQYLEAFKKGAYNVIKEEDDGEDLIPRKYFSGGQLMAISPKVVSSPAEVNRVASEIDAAGTQLAIVAASAAETPQEASARSASSAVNVVQAVARNFQFDLFDNVVSQIEAMYPVLRTNPLVNLGDEKNWDEIKGYYYSAKISILIREGDFLDINSPRLLPDRREKYIRAKELADQVQSLDIPNQTNLRQQIASGISQTDFFTLPISDVSDTSIYQPFLPLDRNLQIENDIQSPLIPGLRLIVVKSLSNELEDQTKKRDLAHLFILSQDGQEPYRFAGYAALDRASQIVSAPNIVTYMRGRSFMQKAIALFLLTKQAAEWRSTYMLSPSALAMYERMQDAWQKGVSPLKVERINDQFIVTLDPQRPQEIDEAIWQSAPDPQGFSSSAVSSTVATRLRNSLASLLAGVVLGGGYIPEGISADFKQALRGPNAIPAYTVTINPGETWEEIMNQYLYDVPLKSFENRAEILEQSFAIAQKDNPGLYRLKTGEIKPGQWDFYEVSKYMYWQGFIRNSNFVYFDRVETNNKTIPLYGIVFSKGKEEFDTNFRAFLLGEQGMVLDIKRIADYAKEIYGRIQTLAPQGNPYYQLLAKIFAGMNAEETFKFLYVDIVNHEQIHALMNKYMESVEIDSRLYESIFKEGRKDPDYGSLAHEVPTHLAQIALSSNPKFNTSRFLFAAVGGYEKLAPIHRRIAEALMKIFEKKFATDLSTETNIARFLNTVSDEALKNAAREAFVTIMKTEIPEVGKVNVSPRVLKVAMSGSSSVVERYFPGLTDPVAIGATRALTGLLFSERTYISSSNFEDQFIMKFNAFSREKGTRERLSALLNDPDPLTQAIASHVFVVAGQYPQILEPNKFLEVMMMTWRFMAPFELPGRLAWDDQQDFTRSQAVRSIVGLLIFNGIDVSQVLLPALANAYFDNADAGFDAILASISEASGDDVIAQAIRDGSLQHYTQAQMENPQLFRKIYAQVIAYLLAEEEIFNLVGMDAGNSPIADKEFIKDSLSTVINRIQDRLSIRQTGEILTSVKELLGIAALEAYAFGADNWVKTITIKDDRLVIVPTNDTFAKLIVAQLKKYPQSREVFRQIGVTVEDQKVIFEPNFVSVVNDEVRRASSAVLPKTIRGVFGREGNVNATYIPFHELQSAALDQAVIDGRMYLANAGKLRGHEITIIWSLPSVEPALNGQTYIVLGNYSGRIAEALSLFEAKVRGPISTRYVGFDPVLSAHFAVYSFSSVNQKPQLISWLQEYKTSEMAVTSSALVASSDDKLGGITFDPSKLNLQIKRDGRGVPLPLPQQDLKNININGLYPVIINIMPINSQTLPILGQLNTQPDVALSKS